MACNCQGKREQYEVVTAAGKVVFTSGSKPTAQAVSRRYPESSVREKGKTDTNETTHTAGRP